MSRRHILEDSDSDGDGDGDGDGSPTDSSFFTAEEERAIEKCQIQINDDHGKYSEALIAQAIADMRSMLEDCGHGGKQLHRKYRVKKGEHGSFLEQDVFKIHGANVDDDEYDASPSEETILINIEALRLSPSNVVNAMFKKIETGGHVVFGAWWNYSLQRVLQLSSDESAKDESLGMYTAVMILRSLFAFIKVDLKAAISDKVRLKKLNTKFGIDWVANLKRARKVIDSCGPSHFLDKELSAVEAHIAGLPDKLDKKGNEKAAPAANANVDSSKQTQLDAEKEKKRKAEAAKKRKQAMLGSIRRTVDSRPTDTAASTKRAVASSNPGGRDSFSRGNAPRSVDPTPPKSGALMAGSGRAPSPGGFRETRTSPERRAGDCHNAMSPPESSAKSSSSAAPSVDTRSDAGWGRNRGEGASAQPCKTSAAPSVDTRSDEGWGRKRGEGASAQPFKTKGSWKFARRALSSNIPESVRQGQVAPAGNNSAAPQEGDAHGGRAGPSALSGGAPARGGRGGAPYDSGRHSGSYSSRSGNRGESRYDSRSPEGSREGGGRFHQRDRPDYPPADNHRGGGPEGSSRDGYDTQGAKPSRSQDYDGDLPPPKRSRGSHEISAPAGGGGRGRDRTKPAWLTRDQSSGSQGPTGIRDNNNNLPSNLGPAVGGINASHASTVPLNQPPAVPSRGRGRGRGVKPAWTTGPTGMPNRNQLPDNITGGNGDGAFGRDYSAHLHPERASANQNAHTAMEALHALNSRNTSNLAGRHASMGAAGAVRGQGWENQASLQPPVINQPGPAVGSAAHVHGGGQGRGRGRTLPAWMTNSNS